jgi:hypothetical protein
MKKRRKVKNILSANKVGRLKEEWKKIKIKKKH